MQSTVSGPAADMMGRIEALAVYRMRPNLTTPIIGNRRPHRQYLLRSDYVTKRDYSEFDSFPVPEENRMPLPRNPIPLESLEESSMRWVFALSLIWCVAMFVAVALCRAAGASDVSRTSD